jgi:hypothetical protein
MKKPFLIQCPDCNFIRDAEEERCPECDYYEPSEPSDYSCQEPSWVDFWHQCEELKGKF